MSALLEYLKYVRKRGLFQVIYHVTRKCNARCLSCFSWKRTLEDAPELSLDELRKITSSMPAFPWLLLSGGEPFLRDDLPEVVSIFYHTNRVRHITIPTNGLLSDRISSAVSRVCDTVADATLNLVLSIDGVGEEHDRMRGTPGNFDALMKTWEMVKPLRGSLPNLSVKFHTVLSNSNYMHFEEIRDFVETLRPELHTFDFIRGDPADKSLTLPPEDTLPDLCEKIKTAFRRYGGYERLRRHHTLLKDIYALVMEDYYDQFLKIRRERRQTIPCVADRLTMVLGASGEVSLCEMLPQIGSFRDFDYNFDALWNSPASREARKDVAARKCYCYHPCYQTVSVLLRPTSVAAAVARRLVSGRPTG